MPSQAFSRQYDHLSSHNAPRIKPEVWEKFHNEVTTHHNQGCTKKEILDELKMQKFHPSYVHSSVCAVKLTYSRMGQLISQMRAWGLFADRRSGMFATEGTETPVPATQNAVGAGICTEDSVTISDRQAHPDTLDEAVNGTPQVKYETRLSCVLELIKTQTGPTSAAKEARAIPYNSSALANDKQRFDYSLLMIPTPRYADDHLFRDSLLWYHNRLEGTEGAHHHGDIRPNSDSDHVVDDSVREASPISLTPPLTLAETSSMDDDSLNAGDSELESAFQPAGRLQRPNLVSSDCASNRLPDLTKTLMSRVGSGLIDDVEISCELLALWPGFRHPQTLKESQIHEIRGAATSLAAAGVFDDAFDLSYVEYMYWRACERGHHNCDRVWPCNRRCRTSDSNVSRHEPIRYMVTATVNCARTCRTGRRQEIAQQIIEQSLATLLKQRLANSLESALLKLYLSNLLEICALRQVSQRHQNDALGMVVGCGEANFSILLPDIQDREYLFMAQTLEQQALRSFFGDNDLGGSGALSSLYLNTIERKIADPKHLLNCEDMTLAFETLLNWYKDVIRRNRIILDSAGGPLRATFSFRAPAAWLLYCFCVCETSIDPTIQNKLEIFQVPLCTHGSRRLRLDTPLALAVITENFWPFSTDRKKGHSIGPSFSSYCTGELDAILRNKTTRCRDIITAYLSRIQNLPATSKGLNPLGGASSILVKEVVKAAVQAIQSLSQIDYKELTQGLSKAFLSPEVPERSSRPTSGEGSIRSSLNTIRSSMSIDTKQIVEMKVRLRQSTSMLSIRRKDSSRSNASSNSLRWSDSFEGVTGMPASGPAAADLAGESVRYRDTMMVERIDEEMHDVDVDDGAQGLYVKGSVNGTSWTKNHHRW